MQTKTLIQAQANVLKVTSLRKGDVVKMIEEKYSNDYEIYYGVVVELLNSGEKTFIQFLRYKKEYSSVDVDLKLFSGEKEIALFPATIEELKEHFGSCIKEIANKIKDKKEELAKLEKTFNEAKLLESGELQKQLTECSYKEITQQDYDKQKLDLLG